MASLSTGAPSAAALNRACSFCRRCCGRLSMSSIPTLAPCCAARYSSMNNSTMISTVLCQVMGNWLRNTPIASHIAARCNQFCIVLFTPHAGSTRNTLPSIGKALAKVCDGCGHFAIVQCTRQPSAALGQEQGRELTLRNLDCQQKNAGWDLIPPLFCRPAACLCADS